MKFRELYEQDLDDELFYITKLFDVEGPKGKTPCWSESIVRVISEDDEEVEIAFMGHATKAGTYSARKRDLATKAVKLSDKPKVIKALLESTRKALERDDAFRHGNAPYMLARIKIIRDEVGDWPELKVIEKTWKEFP